MLAIIISILMSMGVITYESDYQNLSQEEQEYYETTIVTEDLSDL